MSLIRASPSNWLISEVTFYKTTVFEEKHLKVKYTTPNSLLLNFVIGILPYIEK